MDNIFYIVTSKANRTVFCSDNFHKIADFIKLNQDGRIRTVGYTGKPKIMSKELFLYRFLEFTKDKITFFILARLMIADQGSFSAFLRMKDMKADWNEFKQEFL